MSAAAAATQEASKKLAVVSAGLGRPSSTRLLADRLAESALDRLRADGVETEVTVVELRDLAHDITNNLLTGFPAPKLDAAIAAVAGADGLIAVTPIFTASYSGLFKSFVDVLAPESLAGLPVLIGATGGTERHSLALDHALRPLFSYLRAVVVPTGVYAASSDWGSSTAAGGGLTRRIERAGRELGAFVVRSDRSTRVRDPFALDPSFSPVAAAVSD